MFNYGMMPMTWENNERLDRETGCYGDNDPLDIVEMSPNEYPIGYLKNCKVLGALCLLD